MTPGVYDHRPLVPRYGIPRTLQGKRVLDVASADGFWAFEFERREAATVVSCDVDLQSSWDWPPELRESFVADGLDRPSSRGFHIAKRALGSRVERLNRSVYDLTPDVDGLFDFVHLSDVLIHLSDPLRALRAVRSVTSGSLLLADCVDAKLRGNVSRYLSGGWVVLTYTEPSLDALVQMLLDAGFADICVRGLYNLPAQGEDDGPWRALISATA